MRDAQHGVEPLGGPWPAAVIQDLPVGVLEVDERGRVVQANPALARLLPGRAVASEGAGAAVGVPVAECWPVLADAAAAALAGRTVDMLLVTPQLALRVRGVPRLAGATVHGGLLVVTEAEGDRPRPAVVDVRDHAGRNRDGDAPGEPEIATARTGPSRRTVLAWRRTPPAPELVQETGTAGADGEGTGTGPGPAPAPARIVSRTVSRTPGRRHETAGRADQHAATHDPVTGLPNTVLLRQCLADALATCRPGRRVGVLVVELSGAGGNGLREVAGRLTQVMGPRDVVGRLPGDRFAVVLPQMRATADLESLLGKVAAVVRGEARPRARRAACPDRLGMVLVDPVHGAECDRDPQVVLALALEALERSRGVGRPVVAPERPGDAERARIAALRSYDVHDSALDEALHSVAQLAAQACEAFAGLVTFLDQDLQWVRAASGADLMGYVDGHGPRHLALCDRTIRGRDVLVVRDTERDPEFRASRHIGWQLGMRFYAGAPLITPDGRAIGTVCVLDSLPRRLTDRQRHSLTVLAAETVAVLEAHRARG